MAVRVLAVRRYLVIRLESDGGHDIASNGILLE
jgi:hypothetical protein